MSIEDIELAARVLVVIVPRPIDLKAVREQGWYRIPLARAPRGIQAEYLAFYLTARFGVERWSVRSIAAVRSVNITTRAMLLPDEPHHPRANERYYRFALGPLQSLPMPVPSRKLRRISFIATTAGQLLRASDVAELWHPLEDDDLGSLPVWGAGVNRRW